MDKEKIDIEALLVWAYRDHRVFKRDNPYLQAMLNAPRREASPSDNARRIGELGTMIQTGGLIEKPITRIITDKDADAVIIDDAVFRLEDFYAEFQTESRIRLWTQEAALAEEGGIVAVGTGGHREFTLLLPNRSPRPVRPLTAAAIVVSHARSATRPDCFPRWQPRRGRRPTSVEDARGRARQAVDVDAREVALARASYQVWRMSLEWLAVELDGNLSCYSVTGPVAESEPWQLEDAA